MYLNLDLLYNIDKYLFPLFYYTYECCDNSYVYAVYTPTTKKAVFKNEVYIAYSDYMTKKYEELGKIFYSTNHKITENIFIQCGYIFKKCEPFELDKKDFFYLKNNTRIN